MKSSPHRPLILKRRKLSLSLSDASSTQAREEPSGQSNGSSNQEHSQLGEPSPNGEPPGTQEVPAGIKIINHPTMPNTQVVVIPANTDIQTILKALTVKGKASGSNGPNKFILISSGSNSRSMETWELKDLLKSEGENSVTCKRPQEGKQDLGPNSGTMEEPTIGASESQAMEGQEQEGNSNEDPTSCGLDNSLTNIQWLGKMSSNGLGSCPLQKETEKENLTPKQETVKAGEGSAPPSSSTSWQESFSERPPYSYMALIQFAINSTERRRMLLKDIYTWIEDHFPYFKHVAKPGWKNSIRHNLSLHDMFIREFCTTANLSYWTIHPKANRYLTLDQVFKHQKRHTPDLRKYVGSASKTEPQVARRKVKPLLPRVNSYLVPIQFPMSQSLVLQPSPKVSLPAAQGASETVQSSKQVHVASKVLPSSDEPAMCPPAVSSTYSGDESLPLAPQQSTREDARQTSREASPAALCLKEESDSSLSSNWASPFLPTPPAKWEPAQPDEERNLLLPASPEKQKRKFPAAESTPCSVLDTLVIKRREQHEAGRSRRKQHLTPPCSEEPVLVLPPNSGLPSFALGHVLSSGQETLPLENMSHLSCSQGEGGPFKTPVKELLCKVPVSSTPSKMSSTSPPSPAATGTCRVTPLVKEASHLDFSPVRTPPAPLLSLQDNLDLLACSSTPLRQSLFDCPQAPLLNTETNAMVSGPLTSSPTTSKQSSPELTENCSLLEGLVLDTMNDSLSKILLDVSFSGLEDDNLGTDLSWSQLIPELK